MEQNSIKNMTETAPDTLEQIIVDSSFEFPAGIVGFSDFQKFIFAQSPEEKPFAWMRSLDDPSLSFAIVDAFYLKPDYVVDIDDQELEKIGSPNAIDCFILFILRIELGPPFRIYANLRAPLILNRVAKKGMQFVVVDSPYKEDVLFEF
jgi:flagellar assembly factor FliW